MRKLPVIGGKMTRIERKLKTLRKEYPRADDMRKESIVLEAKILKMGRKAKPHYAEFRKQRVSNVMNALT